MNAVDVVVGVLIFGAACLVGLFTKRADYFAFTFWVLVILYAIERIVKSSKKEEKRGVVVHG